MKRGYPVQKAPMHNQRKRIAMKLPTSKRCIQQFISPAFELELSRDEVSFMKILFVLDLFWKVQPSSQILNSESLGSKAVANPQMCQFSSISCGIGDKSEYKYILVTRVWGQSFQLLEYTSEGNG